MCDYAAQFPLSDSEDAKSSSCFRHVRSKTSEHVAEAECSKSARCSPTAAQSLLGTSHNSEAGAQISRYSTLKEAFLHATVSKHGVVWQYCLFRSLSLPLKELFLWKLCSKQRTSVVAAIIVKQKLFFCAVSVFSGLTAPHSVRGAIGGCTQSFAATFRQGRR